MSSDHRRNPRTRREPPLTAYTLALSPKHVAQTLDISVTHAREMMARGELPTVLIGKRRAVCGAVLQSWIQHKCLPNEFLSLRFIASPNDEKS